MKLKIMIMALLLLAGIGSAVNRLPATEFVGNVDMDDNFITSVNKTSGVGVTVGFTPDCDFIVDGDNDSVQIMEANDYLNSTFGGGKIILQEGAYYPYSQIELSRFVEISGPRIPFPTTHPGAGTNWPLLETDHRGAAKFFVTNTTHSQFLLNGGNSLSNIRFAYPNQETNDTPVAYPATIQLADYAGGIRLSNIDCGNAYIFLDADAEDVANIVATDIFGYPLYRGFIVDDGVDSNYFTRCHFVWSFYPERGSVISDFVWDNAEAFQIGKFDNSMITNCFVYGYKSLANMTGSVGVQIVGSSADGGDPCISLTNCTHVTITGGSFSGGVADHTTDSERVCNAIEITGSLCGHNKIYGSTISSSGSGVVINGALGNLIAGCTIPAFGTGNTTGRVYGIIVDGGDNGIKDNVIHANGEPNTVGILYNSGIFCSITGNLVFDTAGWGIATALATSYSIINDNVVINCIGGLVNNTANGVSEDNLVYNAP